MSDEVREYVEYIAKLKEIQKPKMPTFSISAYTDNEYTQAIDAVMKDYENIDDFYLTLQHLKGD